MTIPQTTAVAAPDVRAIRCSLCLAPAAQPCQWQPQANHTQRWLDAYQAGIITKPQLGEAIAQVVIITRWQIVPERAA